MDQGIARRLAIAIAAKGLNMKEASVKAGLNATYARDVIRRGRGKYEHLQRLAGAIGVSPKWLLHNQGEMESANGSSASAVPASPASDEIVSLSRRRLVDAMVAAFRLLEASETQAESLAKFVISIVEDR